MAERRDAPDLVDLHTHSTCSDGSLPAADVIRRAAGLPLAAVALTDHDTTAGLAEAAEEAAQHPHLTFVPGVEVSAVFHKGTLHVLGLGIDADATALAGLLDRLREARAERNPRMAERLRNLGIDVTMDEVRDLADRDRGETGRHIVSRMHFAQLLVEKHAVASTQQAFARYLGAGAPAYVEKERIAPDEVAEAIHAAGGMAVAAHPVHLPYDNFAQLRRMLETLRDAGIDGVEAYHSDHDAQLTRELLRLARELGMGVAGGSDYHGPSKPHVRLGRPRVPASVVARRFAALLGK